MLLLVSGCASTAESDPGPSLPLAAGAGNASGFPLTVTDDAGRRVTISKAPQRIVSLAPSQTETLYALGLGPRIVGVDQYSDFPPEAQQKPRVSGYARPDLEQVIAMAPDLVLANPIHTRTIVPEMERLKLTVIVLNPATLDGVFESILLTGRVSGEEAAAAALVGQLRDRADGVRAKTATARSPRVFVELSPTLHTPGEGAFLSDLIRRAGGQNVAAGIPMQWPQLGVETLLFKDPEVIILSYAGSETPDGVTARPGWQQIAAVRNNRIAAIDPDLTSRAGPRVVDGLEALARAIHPDAFP
jgi:iron complex transport system substrate-binding protein